MGYSFHCSMFIQKFFYSFEFTCVLNLIIKTVCVLVIVQNKDTTVIGDTEEITAVGHAESTTDLPVETGDKTQYVEHEGKSSMPEK